MKILSKIFILLFLLIILDGCGSHSVVSRFNPNPEINLLAENIDEIFNDTAFSHAHWGVEIKSLQDGKIWYSRNNNKMFMPASNEKIPTTAAALKILGPDFKFTTTLYSFGEIRDSVLHGDLIVVGNGDPTIYSRFYETSLEVFNCWADSLKSCGIKKIDGNIIGYDNLFDENPIGYGWSHGGLDAWYSAEAGPLNFNENYIDLKIEPDPETGKAKITPNVETGYIEIENNTMVCDTGRGGILVSREYGGNKIVVSGIMKSDRKAFEKSPTITNPTHFYVTVLRETFISNGIEVAGKALDCDDIGMNDFQPQPEAVLLVHHSVPLKDILKMLMKRSQNLFAEIMPRAISLEVNGQGSFRMGKKVIAELLESWGIPQDSYAYMDGSGLSRYNYISPSILVTILEKMREDQYYPLWKDFLPVAGIDGTLRRRMKGTSAEGKVFAKTGTISNVRALSGYTTTADGEEIVFSFLVNGHLLSSYDTELITDKVLELITSFSRKNS